MSLMKNKGGQTGELERELCEMFCEIHPESLLNCAEVVFPLALAFIV